MPLSPKCPHCGSDTRQVKAGLANDLQRYKCMSCQRRYTLDHQDRGYPAQIRQEAMRLFDQGLKLRQIAKQLNVNHQSVANWMRERQAVAPVSDSLPFKEGPGVGSEPDPPLPSNVRSPASSTSPAVDVAQTKRRPTISDVARMAGVSTATVSSFINDKGRMGPPTRKRIQAAMEALHYTPNALVRAIRQQRTRIFGVLLFGLASLDEHVGDSLTPPLLAGISHAADKAEHDMLLYSGWPDHPERHSGLSFLNGHIDGLVWVAPEMREPAMERVAAAGLPVVAMLSRHVPDGVGYINADNFGAMRQLVDHLTDFGHTRIAYFGPAHSSNFKDRIDGYRAAIHDIGLGNSPTLEAVLEYPLKPSSPAAEIDRWLAMPNRPTAIICADDGLAAAAFDTLQARGLRAPEDMALTGFNDIFDAGRIAGGLTTIRQPFREMGQLAAERLLAMIDGASVDTCRITLPTELIIRTSTGG